MALLNKAYAYSKMENEDPEEVKHRRAQFMIYRTMQKADVVRRRPSWLRVKMFKLKIKIGKRFKKLKKSFSSTLLFSKQIACLLKSCKHLLHAAAPKQQQPPMARSTPRPIFSADFN